MSTAPAPRPIDVRSGRARDLRRQIGHVRPLVAALGHVLAAGPRLDRLAEQPDLVAGVVEVVLPLDRVPVVLEDPRERVAVGGVAPARRDQRAGRIGRDELDRDPLRLDPRHRAPNRSPASSTDRSAPRCHASDSHEVQEAGARDLGPLESLAEQPLQLGAKPLGDLARRRAEHGRQQHRGVRRVVALTLVPRPVERRRHRRRPGATPHRSRRALDRRGELRQRTVRVTVRRHTP